MKKLTFLSLSAVFFMIGFVAVLLPKKSADCANSVTCIANLETQVNNTETGTFLGEEVQVPQINLVQELPTTTVLGEHTDESINPEDKHIYVDLSQQKLYAYNNTEEFFSTLVSTGRWGWTPTGDFRIWIKIRSTKMSGGSGNDYYYLPNVPYVMYFYNEEIPKARGYGLHGAYWHNNFGHEMSHGCINLREIDAKVLYDWASPETRSTTTYATTDDPGTQLTICDELEIREGEKPRCRE